MSKCKFPGCITEIASKQFSSLKEDDYPDFCFLHSRILTQNEIKYDRSTGRFYQYYNIHNSVDKTNKKIKKIFPVIEIMGLKELTKKEDFWFERLNEKILINT